MHIYINKIHDIRFMIVSMDNKKKVELKQLKENNNSSHSNLNLFIGM
jgi:hypothetical protein